MLTVSPLSSIPIVYQSIAYRSASGKTIIRRMFSDLAASTSPSSLGRVGTVQWAAREGRGVQVETVRIERVKVYPLYIHWLKDFPPSLMTLPYTHARLRKRVNLVKSVAEKLQHISESYLKDNRL